MDNDILNITTPRNHINRFMMAKVAISSMGTIVDCDKTIEDVFGFTKENIINKDFFSVFSSTEQQAAMLYEEILLDEKDFSFQYECILNNDFADQQNLLIVIIKNDSQFLFQTIALITYKDNFAFFTNYSSLNTAYNQLRDAERIAHLGHWDWDLKEDKLTWSEEMIRIMGYSSDTFQPSYNTLIDSVHEDDQENMKIQVRNSLEGEADYFTELRVRRPDGSIRYLQTQGETSFSKTGEPIRMFGTSLDITARKLAEIEIKNLNTRLTKRAIERKVILDNVSDGIVFINNKSEILFINQVASKLLGVENRDDIVGKKVESLDFNPDNINKCLTGLNYSNKRVDFRIGTEKYQHIVSGRPIRDHNDNIIGAIEIMTGIEEVTSMIRAVADPHYTAFSTIIGRSQQIRDAIAKAQVVSKSDYLVLIQGESGTGKDLFANSIHIESGRSGAFIPINCAALPAELLESELFGYSRGAFTGAERNGKAGLFEEATDGTIFLDEIAEMPLPLQAKLLRVIQDNKIRRIGGKREKKLNVRIIAATHRNLAELVREKKFREDLFYRINIIPLDIPSLRRRKEDIPELSNIFLRRANSILNKKIKSITTEAMEKLITYHWPGNVRELKNVIERAAIFCEGSRISLSRIDFGNDVSPKASTEDAISEWNLKDKKIQELVEQFEKLVIEQKLPNYGSIREAAKDLGISHTTLIRKLKKYSLKML